MSIAAPGIQPEADDVEASLRNIVRRDLSSLRRPLEPPTIANGEQFKAFVQNLSGASIAEVERTIDELTNVRDTLRSEAERVLREISAYAGLAQSTQTSMKVILDSLAKWQANSRQVDRR